MAATTLVMALGGYDDESCGCLKSDCTACYGEDRAICLECGEQRQDCACCKSCGKGPERCSGVLCALGWEED